MGLKRPSNKILDMLYKQQGIAAKQLETARILSEGCKTEFWRRMVEIIEAKKKAAQTELDGFAKLNDDQRTILLQMLVDYRMFLAMPGDFAFNVKLFEVKMATIKGKIDDYREKMKNGSD